MRSCRGKHVEIDNPYKITVLASNLPCIIGENVVGLFHISALCFVSLPGVAGRPRAFTESKLLLMLEILTCLS